MARLIVNPTTGMLEEETGSSYYDPTDPGSSQFISLSPDPNLFQSNGQPGVTTPPPSSTSAGSESGAAVPMTSLASFSQAANWPGFDAPKFQGPAPFSYQDFQAPTLADAQNEPGYAFAMDQGRKALETSAAAKGTLRTGGTLKDLFAWGNKFGEQNYGNVYNRAANTYSLNRNNAADTYATNYGVSRDVFDRNYKGAYDTFGFAQRNRELDFAREWDNYLAQLDLQKTIFGAGLS